MSEKIPIDQKGRFYNPHTGNIHRKPRDFLLWLFGFFRDVPFENLPNDFSYPQPFKKFDPKKPWAMWIGHSTYLISIKGKHILTDPIWSKRCSPIPFCGPKRKIPPPLTLDQLPKIDYILISHDHYDHLDLKTVEKLFRRFPHILWIIPKGVRAWFEKQQIKNIIELNWWEEVDIHSTFKVTAVPTQHFSGRKFPHQNNTLWAGFIVEELMHSKVFYFVGDTGYNPIDFKRIGKKFPKIDLSLIPIGSYSPRKFMAPVHIEPRDAVKIHQDVGSKLSLAMHWKTFRLSEEPMDQPAFDLFLSMNQQQLDPLTFIAMDPGYKINW